MGNTFAFIGLATVIVQGGLVGRLVRKFGEFRLLKYGTYIFIVAMTMLPWVTKATFIPLELVALALIALANGCLTPSITSLLSKTANHQEVGQVLGVNQSFGSVARAAGMGMSGFIYGIDFHLPFLLAAALMIICIWLAANLENQIRPESPQ
jgi:MFS family permease